MRSITAARFREAKGLEVISLCAQTNDQTDDSKGSWLAAGGRASCRPEMHTQQRRAAYDATESCFTALGDVLLMLFQLPSSRYPRLCRGVVFYICMQVPKHMRVMRSYLKFFRGPRMAPSCNSSPESVLESLECQEHDDMLILAKRQGAFAILRSQNDDDK